MLTRLRIKNLKCLQDTGDLDIRPLTFLVGPNSSGKSTLLQMLLMLRQTVDSTDWGNPLTANGGWVEMGAYPEFIYKGEHQRELEVDLEFAGTVSGSTIKPKDDVRPYKLRIHAAFSYDPKTTQIQLKETEISQDSDCSLRIARDPEGSQYSASFSYNEDGKGRKWNWTGMEPKKFYDLPSIESLFFVRTSGPVSIEQLISKEFGNLFYLGPLRDYPKRIYLASGEAPRDVGSRGERAADALWLSHRSGAGRIERQVRSWFKRLNVAKDVRLEKVFGDNYFRIVIINPATNTETNIADIGFGASQTLPIIIESFYAPPGSVVLIEQPEIHLHPKAQSALGDLFIEAVTEADRSLIIETHSEHVLARVRRRIAEGKITKEKVAIYYFQPTEDGTEIQEVTLNEQGQYESFPEGFFEEDVIEAFEHLKAMKASASA